MPTTITDAPASIGFTADQVAAINSLISEVGAFAIDIAPDTFRSLRAVTFHAAPADDEDAECRVRFWTISVAGTIREQAAEPDGQVAA